MAAQFVKEFYQDLHSPIYLRHGGQILFGGDSKSTILTIHLTDNGEEYTGGGVVTGTAIRTKDGGTVPLTGSISGGTVTVTLISNCFYQPGAPINVFVKLSSSDIETTILGVVYDVITTSTSNTIDPSGEITINVNTLITEINEAIATIPPEYDDMMGSIAPAYTDLTFPIDAYKQLCWYDGLLYINNVDITTGENWTPAHWTATDVSGEFADLCDNLILAQTTQPTVKYNKIWVDAETPEGIQVPTYSEFSSVESTVNGLAKNIKDGTGTGAIVEGLTEAIGATPANDASGQYAHAEGYITTASASYAHAEGIQTKATNNNTHAEGQGSEASGRTSHAEGYNTKATGEDSHAEGDASQATGRSAHAEGVQTRAIGNYSHAQGSYTRATHKAQHVFGEYNVDDGSSATASARGNYVEIVGNGTSSSNKSNARTLDWSGNETLKGDLTIKKGVTGEKSMSALVTEVEALQTSVGNTPMGTEATTITGAIKEHGDDLEDLQSAFERNVTDIPYENFYTKCKPNNLIKKYALIKGEYINSTGGVSTSSSWNRTDYIDISDYTKICMSGNVGNSAFYDSSKEFISTVTSNVTGYSVPEGAVYMRCSVNNTYIDTAMLNGGANVLAYDDGYVIVDTSYIEKLKYILTVDKTFTGKRLVVDAEMGGALKSITPTPDVLVVNGINQWNEEWELGYYSVGNGEPQSSNNMIRSKTNYPIPVLPGTEYYWEYPLIKNAAFLFYDSSKTFISYITKASSGSFTTPNNAYYVKFYLTGDYGTTYNNDIQIAFNDDEEKTVYHPYNGVVYKNIECATIPAGKNYLFSQGADESLTAVITVPKNVADKKPYESGYIHFTVPVNKYIVDESVTTDTEVDNENSIADVDCILSLPTSYSPVGKPTKLVMMCHGAGRGVYGDETAFDGQGDWRSITGYNRLVSAIIGAGYAVFDCNGYDNTQLGCSFWGAERGIQAWRKAYDYVVRNYNVEENISIYGFSMGGCTALDLVLRNFPNVKCIAVGSPVTTLDQTTYEHAGSTAFNAAWGITEYNSDVLRGNDPMQNVVTINSTDYCFKTLPPLKIWFGGNETWPAPSDAVRLVNAIKNAGGKATFRSVDGKGHGICYGEDTVVVNEIVMFFNRYNY